VLGHAQLAAQQPATLRVGTTPSDASKAIFYARNAGIFQKYGLNVEITIVNSGSAGLAAVAGGALDLVNTSILPVAQAHLRGVPFQIVAPTNLYTSERPATLLITRKDAPIHSGRDLNGKTIASSSLKDLNTGAAFTWIDQTGGDHRTVRVVELPASEGVAALESGRVDAVSLTTPFWDEAVAAGRARILAKSLDTIARRFEVSGFVANGDAVAKNPDEMSRFARAMHEAILYTNSHLDATVDLVASYSGIAPAVIAKSMRVIDPEYVEARLVQPVIDAAVKSGLLDQRFDAREIISGAAVRPPR
jgi:ABC-type nitrate/sulfonate/bicarbonate transport system substrate-binding protein